MKVGDIVKVKYGWEYENEKVDKFFNFQINEEFLSKNEVGTIVKLNDNLPSEVDQEIFNNGWKFYKKEMKKYPEPKKFSKI